MNLVIISLLSLIGITLFFNIKFSLLLLIFLIIIIARNYNNLSIKNIMVFVFVFLLFLARTWHALEHNYSRLENKEGNYNVKVVDLITINGNFLKTVGYIEDEKVVVNYKLKTEEEKNFFIEKFNSGTLEVSGLIEDITDKKNYYSFDFKKYNEYKGVFKKITMENIKTISQEDSGLYDKLKTKRVELIKNIQKNITFNKQGYFEALIFGDKSNMLKDDIDNFKNLGISHLLAISGLHIATLIGCIYFLFKKLSFSNSQIDKIVLVFLPLYAILAGANPSVLRASIMIIVFIILKRINIDTLSSLLITFLLITFYNPLIIFDIGFQFSFFITFSIILSKNYIENGKNKMHKLFRVSLVSFIASLPIQISNFYIIPYVSVLSNIVFVPYFTIILLPFVLISYCIFLISGSIFNYVCVPILNFLFSINNFLERIFGVIPSSYKIGYKGEFYSYFVLIFVIIILVLLNKYLYKKVLLLVAVIILLLTIYNKVNTVSRFEKLNINNREVYFIRNNSETLLVNTSNNNNEFYKDFRKKTNKYNIATEYDNLLNFEGINNIKYLLLTETTSKDIGYSNTLIGSNKVGALLLPEHIIKDEKIKEIINLAKFKNINIYVIQNNSTYKINNINIKYYNNNIVLENGDNKFKVTKEN